MRSQNPPAPQTVGAARKGRPGPRTALGVDGMYTIMLAHMPGSVSSGNWQSGCPRGGGWLIWYSYVSCAGGRLSSAVSSGTKAQASVASTFPLDICTNYPHTSAARVAGCHQL